MASITNTEVLTKTNASDWREFCATGFLRTVPNTASAYHHNGNGRHERKKERARA